MKKTKSKNKKMTLEELARMTARGFDRMATKEDLNRMATKEDLNRMATKEEMNSRFDELRSEMNTQFFKLEGKIELYTSFWHRKFDEHETWLQNLDKSVANLERIVGKK